MWLPHGLREISEHIIKYIKTGEIDTTSICPSFPSGGIIVNADEVHTIYETGKGKVVLRGRAEIKDDNILITELPYQIYVEPFIDEIKSLIEKEKIKGIKDVYNKTDKHKMLIEIVCDKGCTEKVLNELYNLTNLQKQYNANQWALVDKIPRLLTFKDYCDVYINHNISCIIKEAEYDIDKISRRLNIVNGLLKALEDIDNVITMIKKSSNSSEAKTNLMAAYNFNEAQAQAIIDMKLGRLANLEKIEINKEKEQLEIDLTKANTIVADENVQKQLLIERLTNFVDKFGDTAKMSEIQNINYSKKKDSIIPENCIIAYDMENNILYKKDTAWYNKYIKPQKRGGVGTKVQPYMYIYKTNTIEKLLMFDVMGKEYFVKVNDIKDSIKLDNNIIAIIPTNYNPKDLLFITSHGMVKRTKFEEYANIKRQGTTAIKLKDDFVINVHPIYDDTNEVFICNTNNKILRFNVDEIPIVGKNAMGVKGQKLKEHETIFDSFIRTNEKYIIICSDEAGTRISIDDIPKSKRYRVGSKISDSVLFIDLINDNDILYISNKTHCIKIVANEIPITNKSAIGVKIIKNGKIDFVKKI